MTEWVELPAPSAAWEELARTLLAGAREHGYATRDVRTVTGGFLVPRGLAVALHLADDDAEPRDPGPPDDDDAEPRDPGPPDADDAEPRDPSPPDDDDSPEATGATTTATPGDASPLPPADATGTAEPAAATGDVNDAPRRPRGGRGR